MAGAAPAPGQTPRDERILLALPYIVLTLDADSIKIAGETRTMRSHTYLPVADENGYVAYASTVAIDCAKKLSRSAAGVGVRADGRSAPFADDEAQSPIVIDTPVSVLRNQTCPLKSADWDVGGMRLYAPPQMASRAIFALLKLGVTSKPAAVLASEGYDDHYSLSRQLTEQKIPPAKQRAVIAALGALVTEAAQPPAPIVPQAAAVRSGRIGEYVHTQMELVAGLWLKADGTFEYGATVGGLDEAARGNWTAQRDRIVLTKGAMRAQPGDLDPSAWSVTVAGDDLTWVRDGQPMLFHLRRK